MWHSCNSDMLASTLFNDHDPDPGKDYHTFRWPKNSQDDASDLSPSHRPHRVSLQRQLSVQ